MDDLSHEEHKRRASRAVKQLEREMQSPAFTEVLRGGPPPAEGEVVVAIGVGSLLNGEQRVVLRVLAHTIWTRPVAGGKEDYVARELFWRYFQPRV